MESYPFSSTQPDESERSESSEPTEQVRISCPTWS